MNIEISATLAYAIFTLKLLVYKFHIILYIDEIFINSAYTLYPDPQLQF